MPPYHTLQLVEIVPCGRQPTIYFTHSQMDFQTLYLQNLVDNIAADDW